MLELEPLPGGKEFSFGPTDKLLIVKSDRTIAQEQGWIRYCLDRDLDGDWLLRLKGLGLKRVDHPLEETNIYQAYPHIDSPSRSSLETIVKDDLRTEGSWRVLTAKYDPLLRDNMYFGEYFCNPSTKTDNPKESTVKINVFNQLIIRPLRLTLEAASHILTPWTRYISRKKPNLNGINSGKRTVFLSRK